MLTSFLARSRRGAFAVAALAALATSACQDQLNNPTNLLDDTKIQSEVVVGFDLSDVAAAPGDRVSVGLRAGAPEGVTLGGIEGSVRFNPNLVRFVGQLPKAGTVVAVNATEGSIHLLGVSPSGLEEVAATLAFEVISTGYANHFGYESVAAVSLDEEVMGVRFDRSVRQNAFLANPADALVMDEAAWSEFMGARSLPSDLMLVPGQYGRYGDATGDGNVNVLDVLYVANLAVGQRECIKNTGATPADPNNNNKDCQAANVRPDNLPGLGEPGDACPPGVDSGCASGFVRTVNVLDVLPIALEGVGQNQTIVGETIPKATPTGFTEVATHCGLTVSAGKAILTGSCTLAPTTTWRITDYTLQVGDETTGATGAGVLEVLAGATVEGTDTTAILVTRNGRLNAVGTLTQPITFTCVPDEATPSGRAPACWGGIYIAGNATINENVTGSPPAPVIPGRNGGGALNQRTAEGFVEAVWHGGDNDADNSGHLEFVRIMFGGRGISEANELNNLTIGSCGSGTILRYLQVHAGLDDGLEIFGGRCNVEYLYATANDDDQFDYSFGYDGKAQFIIAQLGDIDDALTQGDAGFEVDNTETSGAYCTNPTDTRTDSQIWNVTMVAGSGLNASQVKKVMNYRRCAVSTLKNAVYVNFRNYIDFDNETCNTLGDETAIGDGLGMVIDETLILRNAAGGTVNASSCAAGSSGFPTVLDYLNTENFQSRTYANELVDPFNKVLPDFRPFVNLTGTNSSSATFSGTAVPAGFHPATYIGAVRSVAARDLPWYAGWTAGWFSATDR